MSLAEEHAGLELGHGTGLALDAPGPRVVGPGGIAGVRAGTVATTVVATTLVPGDSDSRADCRGADTPAYATTYISPTIADPADTNPADTNPADTDPADTDPADMADTGPTDMSPGAGTIRKGISRNSRNTEDAGDSGCGKGSDRAT